MRISIFRIFYSTSYTLFAIITLGLVIITPADAIKQALTNNQLYNVFVVAGSYFLTLIIATIIYASRIYTNRSVLAAIPKTWIPVEKEDVSKGVRKMVVESLNRSVAIAWAARPRITKTAAPAESPAQDGPEEVKRMEPRSKRRFLRKAPTTDNEKLALPTPPKEPVWGVINHQGWSSPLSPDLPNLQYITVIQELPHLIEAKAVSLAPTDPGSSSDQPVPDYRAIEYLHRPSTMGLRDYVTHLTVLGVITAVAAATTFLTIYERARFFPHPLSEDDFRHLMTSFTEILRGMAPLSAEFLDALDLYSDIEPLHVEEESDIDDDGSTTSTPVTHYSRRTPVRTASHRSSSNNSTHSGGTVRTAPPRRLGTNGTATTRSGKGFFTAPATPMSREERAASPLTNRTPSFSSSLTNPRLRGPRSVASSASLRSEGSVIRLSSGRREAGGLPYTLHIPG